MQKLSFPANIQIYVNPRDQRKAIEFFRRCPEIMRKAYEKGARRFATILLQIVKRALATGVPPPGSGVSWPPLSEKTKKAYKSWGYENAHPWYLIGQMYRRVGIFATRSQNKELRVGFPQGVRATHPNKKSRSNLNQRPTITRLARMLEEGTDGIPPRPLFAPAFKAAGGEARLNHFIVEELKKEFRKYT